MQNTQENTSINRTSNQVRASAYLEIEEDPSYALPLECDEGRRTDHYNNLKGQNNANL